MHGSARWATEKDMVEAGVLNQTEGVYIGGWYDPAHQALKYLRHDGPEHVLAFAPTRSGKGIGLVIPTLLGWTESCVVYDIKGENWEKTAGYRHRTGHLCLQFAPCDESGKTTRFNPLNEIRVFSLRDVSDAQNMADILVKSMENRPNDTHWIDTAAQIVTGALLHLCYKARNEGREANLGDLASHFSVFGKGFRDTLTEMSNEEHDPHGTMNWTLPNGRPTRTHPVVLQHVQTMKDKADKEFSSVVSTVNTAVAVYADPLLRRNTAASDFTVDDLVNFEKPVSLYIVVPPSDWLRLTPLVRLTFTLIVNRLTQRMAFAPPPTQEAERSEAKPGAGDSQATDAASAAAPMRPQRL
ncbi:MAG: type IV secretory system conjugative DNA transfer family protein [Bryobacteraceae bacterium]